MMDPDEQNTLLNGEKRRIRFYSDKKVLIGVGVVVIVVIAVATTLGLILSGGKKSSNPDPNYHQEFKDLLDPSSLKEEMRYYSSNQHIAGSGDDSDQAIYTLNKWLSYGISATIQEIPVLLSYPKERSVEIVYPEDKRFKCSLEEAVLPDGTSGNVRAVPPWNGYSASGNVTGDLIYANYGTLQDFQYLDSLNISLSGKIVIVRYGKIFRGNKAKLAYQRGAIGVLIYVDPGDTGYERGKVYMDGPWSTNTTVQRGSVWTGNGDPTTPGWPSTGDSPRLTLDQARQDNLTFGDPLPTIPIQPLSYGDAEPLLRALQGFPTPAGWAGGFNLTHLGPGPVKVRLSVDAVFNVTPIWNVIGRIEGSEEPDRLVVMGAHRDAWTMGSGDPISGTSVVMETARVFGELLKKGWKPKRTIILASWDAEEYGLIGSVEFAETYYKTLYSQAVVYLNLDVAVSGDFGLAATLASLTISGSPSLRDLVRDVAKDIPIPGGNNLLSVWNPQEIGAMGTGSDHTAFFHHCGISALDLEVVTTDGAYRAVYHSNYDSFYWYSNFGDPTFEWHIVMAKLWGGIALRLADDRILSFNLQHYADTLQSYLKNLEGFPLNFTALENAIGKLQTAAASIASEISAAKDTNNPHVLRSINDRLMLLERAFLGSSVESGREWYLHVVYAPSTTDSYAGVTFPAIAAQMPANPARAQFIVQRIAQIIDEAAGFVSGRLWK